MHGQCEPQVLGDIHGQEIRLNPATDERRVHEFHLPNNEVQAFAQTKQHGLAQLNAKLIQECSRGGRLTVLPTKGLTCNFIHPLLHFVI